MQFKHGAYYFVQKGVWTPLAKDYGAALVKYAALVGKSPEIRTVKDAVWGYIEDGRTRKHKKPLAESTMEGYRRSAQNVCKVFGAMALDDIAPEDVTRYVIESGTVQANRDKALLSAAFTYARNKGSFRGIDPTKGLQVRNQETPRDRYVTDAEMQRLVRASSPKLATALRFIELTGMRQGDALRVRLDDLDDEGIHYRQGKTGKRQVVLWSPELEAVVEDAKRLWRRFGREWLFESKPKGKHAGRGVGPYTTRGFRAIYKRYAQKAGLADVRLHDLRAKAGSDVVTAEEATRLLGHADGKVTKRHYRRKAERVKPLR